MALRFCLLKVPKNEARGWKWIIFVTGWVHSSVWLWRFTLPLPQWIMRKLVGWEPFDKANNPSS